MSRIGLVGGLGPESTIDYYKRLIARWQVDHPESLPPITIDSLDFHEGLRLVASDRPQLARYLATSVNRLGAAGATLVAITANTPHVVFDEVAALSTVPLLSIVEVCADAAERAGVRRPALLGTRFTMEEGFYQRVFQKRGIEIITPRAEEREWIHARYVGELLVGDFRSDTRARLLAIVQRLIGEGTEAVILGGTELPLLLEGASVSVPLLDTTQLHVDAIVAHLEGG